MKMYKKQSDYLISYDIKDDQIIQHYYMDKKEYLLPNTPHNIEVCDRILLKQFQMFRTDGIDHMQLCKINAANRLIPDFMLACMTFLIQIPPLFPILFISCFGRDTYDLIHANQIVQHFQLTDYCLEHALEIKKIVRDPNYTLRLSKKAQKILANDKEFTLNHSDRYSVSDLKQIQKMLIKQKEKI